MHTTNRTVIDLNKVSYANFYWWCNNGGMVHTVPVKPKFPTVHGQRVEDAKHGALNKTMLEYAQEKKLLDVWIPTVALQLHAGKVVRYRGEKALSIWKEWNRRIFNKKK